MIDENYRRWLKSRDRQYNDPFVEAYQIGVRDGREEMRPIIAELIARRDREAENPSLWERIKGWFIEPGPPHNHSEGSWRADCPQCGLPENQYEDMQAYIDAQGPTMNPHKSEDGLWR